MEYDRIPIESGGIAIEYSVLPAEASLTACREKRDEVEARLSEATEAK